MTSVPDPFEAFRQIWGPLGIPLPGMAVPTLDPREVDKRIAELKAVEGWLAMNLNMLRTAIQGMEAQKSILQAMHSTSESVNAAAAPHSGGQPPVDHPAAGDPAARSLMWPWTLMQQAVQASAAGRAQAVPSGTVAKKGKRNE